MQERGTLRPLRGVLGSSSPQEAQSTFSEENQAPADWGRGCQSSDHVQREGRFLKTQVSAYFLSPGLCACAAAVPPGAPEVPALPGWHWRVAEGRALCYPCWDSPALSVCLSMCPLSKGGRSLRNHAVSQLQNGAEGLALPHRTLRGLKGVLPEHSWNT